MNKLHKITSRLLFPLIFVFAAFGWMQAYALADGGGVSAPSVANPLPLPTGWAGLALVALAVASWLVRKVSTKSAFFHTTAGAAVMGVLTAVIPTLIQAIQAHGLQLIALVTAAEGAVLSFIASDNASNSPAVQAAIVEEKKSNVTPSSGPGAVMLLPFIGIAFVLSLAACPAHTGMPTGTGDGGVSSPYTQAFEACIVADGVKLGLSNGSAVLDILESGASEAVIISKLDGLGVNAAGDVATDIIACSVSSWFALNPVTAKAPPTPAQAAVRVFYARHPNLIRK